MTTERTSYENGKRIEIQRVTYERSDDLYTLANLQRRYEYVCEQIDNATEDTNIKGLRAEKAQIEASIKETEDFIAGYSKK